jgi:hypothetical protein
MKTIISLTSIPSRFENLETILKDLLKQKYIDEIWLSIPIKYNRFPDVKVEIPDKLYEIDKKIIIKRCDDYGPGTMYISPALHSDADLIIVVNDDTKYPETLSGHLINSYKIDNCCWCMSGFKIDEYIKGDGKVKYIHNNEIDVTESYGGVILKREWIKMILDDFKELYKLTYNDDIIIGNLFAKNKIRKKILCTPDCNIGCIQQYQFGFTKDALFYNNGDGTHFKNNKKIFKNFIDNDIYYFNT